ncbi:MAG TPA: hypothetical protein VK324_14785 [Tepidisphaeraceae bacterium]|nr:hypothetical protein [Tepidisphaeraceae bacterium]
MPLSQQLLWLVILAIPIACVAWTVTHEEVFREPREYCQHRSRTCRSLLKRKFFYLFTCEYCFSHYVTMFFVAFTGFRLLLDDWRGYVLSVFALVWLANIYMSLYGRLRVDIRSERAEADMKQTETEVKQREVAVKEKEIERLEHELATARDGNGR